MKRKLASVVALACAVAMLTTAVAQATSAFYYNAGLAAWAAVSGTPRSTLSFAGSYTSGGGEYCVGVQTGATYEGINSLVDAACGSGTSVTSSFPARSGRDVTQNGSLTQHMLAEERW